MTPSITETLVWPVYGFTDTRFQRETVAHFFSWGDAASFAMRPEDFGHEKRNLHIGVEKLRPCAVQSIVRGELPPELKRTGTGGWL
jgi:hypothetical protein